MQQDRKKLMEGHFNISITKRVSLENSTDLGRGAAPELKSVEFLSETLLVVEQIDIHTNFTARQMLYLYRSITPSSSFMLLFLRLCASQYASKASMSGRMWSTRSGSTR